MKEKPVFDLDGFITRSSGKWAEEKLYYLRNYIELVEQSMKNKFYYRSFIDLLAGPGKNHIRYTKRIINGSPLIAISTKNPFSDYFFVDSNSEYISALRQRCSIINPSLQIEYFTEDCNNAIDKIISNSHVTSSKALNIAFVDPEGFEVNWKTIKKLASVRRMDLIINYPEGGLNRMLRKCYESPSSSCLDDFFGSDDWRNIYKLFQERKIPNLHRTLIDSMVTNLKNLGYVIEEKPINTEPLVRNTKRNAPQYRLLYASKHSVGNDFWSKITKKDNNGQERLPLIN